MKRKGFLIIALFFLLNQLYSQENQLTKQQKVNDFLYAYNILKDNYPFFGVCKRTNGFDWLSRKNEFIDKVEHNRLFCCFDRFGEELVSRSNNK